MVQRLIATMVQRLIATMVQQQFATMVQRLIASKVNPNAKDVSCAPLLSIRAKTPACQL